MSSFYLDSCSKEELRYKVQGLFKEQYLVERILADALNFQCDAVDDKNSPCSGEYQTGDHTPVTLAMAVARELTRLRHGVVDEEKWYAEK